MEHDAASVLAEEVRKPQAHILRSLAAVVAERAIVTDCPAHRADAAAVPGRVEWSGIVVVVHQLEHHSGVDMAAGNDACTHSQVADCTAYTQPVTVHELVVEYPTADAQAVAWEL